MNFLVWRDIQKKREVQKFGVRGQSPPSLVPLDYPLGKTLRSVLSLLTVMILKRVSESIFFKNIKFLQHVRLKKERG